MSEPVAGGQQWLVGWHPQEHPPAGTNHGSSGLCLTAKGVVLVSHDGLAWEFPAGRPEGEETLLETLRREVLEEACCEVETADLLGFTRSTCLAGHQEGVVLVRSHWVVRATVRPWRPQHEIRHRRFVPPADVLSVVMIEDGVDPIYEAIVSSARDVLG